VTLASEFLRPEPAEREEVQGKAEAGIARGFVQLYEDKKGNPVIAVSFWKPTSEPKAKPKKGKAKAAAAQPSEPTPPDPADDHTDDLYFNKRDGKKKKARRRKTPDPAQLDLFAGPDQQGEETRDPHNPLVVIVDDEGSGSAFGLGDSPLGDIPDE
jgi:hypothetical protein